MRYYLYSAALILLAIVLTTTIPYFTDIAQASFVGYQIPSNNSAVAGIQAYNIPPVSKNLPMPNLSARSILVKDLATGTVLYQKAASLSVPIASTTKIMTALVASSYYKPNDILTVGDAALVVGSRMGLIRGETLKFSDLLFGMLLPSGNDAAFTIAENYPGGVLGFISAMNMKAKSLGLYNTHFDNPAGYDSPNHFSSAKDMAVITEEALKNKDLAKIFSTRETNIVSVDGKNKYDLVNLNKLLTDVKGVLGVKTGYTDLAKENLVTLVNRNGHEILTVVLGSDDRFGESTSLIEWTYRNFTWSALGSLGR